jgi:nucleotide-binding universal stress UspA family protein
MADLPRVHTVPPMPQTILVAVDGGPQQTSALRLATRLARTGDRLVLATVQGRAGWSGPPESQVSPHLTAELILCEARREVGGRPCRTVARIADAPVDALCALAARERADLLVIGSSHRGRVGRAMLGGTGDRLLRTAPCPVVVAPRGLTPAGMAVRRIGAAFDGGPESERALAFAAGLAARHDAALEVLFVVRPDVLSHGAPSAALEERALAETREQGRRRLDEAVASLPGEVVATGRLLDGDPARELAAAAADLDVLVAGSRGRGRLGGVLLGGVTRPLLHDAPCPLVLVPRPAARPAAGAASATREPQLVP